MAKTTLTYNNISSELYNKLLEGANKEFQLTLNGPKFRIAMHAGLIKADGVYDESTKVLTLTVDHPFFVSQSQIQTEINNWLIAEEATPPTTS